MKGKSIRHFIKQSIYLFSSRVDTWFCLALAMINGLDYKVSGIASMPGTFLFPFFVSRFCNDFFPLLQLNETDKLPGSNKFAELDSKRVRQDSAGITCIIHYA